MQNLIRLLTPPIFTLLRDRYFRKSGTRYNGYETSELVSIVINKNIFFRENLKDLLNLNTLRTVSAIGLLGNQKSLNILDFGGGAGHHHATAEAIFPEKEFYWRVVETPTLVKEASEKLQFESLVFCNNLADSEVINSSFDLIFSDSAIQYTDSPIVTVNQLKKLEYKYLFVTRIPLAVSGNSFQYMQKSKLSANGPGPAPRIFKEADVEYKATIIKYKEFKQAISSGCEILFELNEGDWDRARFGETVRMFTFALRKL